MTNENKKLSRLPQKVHYPKANRKDQPLCRNDDGYELTDNPHDVTCGRCWQLLSNKTLHGSVQPDRKVAEMASDAAKASEIFDKDELEAYADRMRAKSSNMAVIKNRLDEQFEFAYRHTE